jgi:gliding motility-associated-like protein
VKYIFIIFLFASTAAFAQSPCPTVQATSATPCSSAPIQLNATTGFTTYNWSPTTGLSNPSIANPIASASGIYTVTATVPGPELVINGDFAAGNTGFTSGMNYSTNYSPGNYYVGAMWFSNLFPGLTDHTPTTDNMFMHIDGASPATMLWEEANLPVQPNTNYTFEFWASRADQVQPIFDIYFVGNVTGIINPATLNGVPYTGTWMWDPYGVAVWNSGANTSVTLRVINLQTNSFGNDFGLDDFSFRTFCVDSDSVQITIAPAPALGPDTAICGNSTVSLNAGTANSYLWNTGDITQTIVVNASGQYFVTTTTGACSFSDTINVTVNAIPVIDLGNDTILCSNQALELEATGSAQTTYAWSTGENTPTILAATTGTYSVIVTNGNCSSIDSIHVSVTGLLDLGDDISLCSTLHAELDAGNPGASYLWSDGSALQTLEVAAAGEYWVEVNNGVCIIRDTVTVSGTLGEGMIFIPNTFTPNGNSVNDKFNAYGEGIISFRMRIFNRWGELLFETTDVYAGWDGIYKGRLVETDTYVYVIDYATQCTGLQEKKVFGHVNVIR